MNPCFETIDLDLAAYLVARAYPVLCVTGDHESPCFQFPPNAALSAEAYYQGATVAAKTILYAIHAIEKLRGGQQLNEEY